MKERDKNPFELQFFYIFCIKIAPLNAALRMFYISYTLVVEGSPIQLFSTFKGAPIDNLNLWLTAFKGATLVNWTSTTN